MAQSGFTPILLYGSSTASTAPLAANLTSSSSGVELALNYTDGKIYYKDNGGVVQLLASKTSTAGTFTTVTDSYGNVRNIPQSGSAKTTNYTLVTTDIGQYIQVGSGGSITIPNSTFATGNAVSLFNNTTGSITVTCSTTNAYIAGTDTNKTSVTLATRGVATILFISSTLCVISGNVS